MTSTVTVDQTTTQTTKTKPAAKSAAVNALATVGFVALLILGITLAIYSARYVPAAVSKLAGFGNSNNSPALAVVSATSTIPFNDSGMVLTSSTTTALPQPSGYTSPNIAAVAPSVTPVSTYHAPKPVGLPDLYVTILATGYLTTNSTDSFVPASIIPPGARPAVRFSIGNDGGSATGPWTFLAHIPSINNFTFNSPTEPSLNPGDHTVFTLGFNEAIPGQSQAITVLADPNDNILESNESNNSAAAAVTITQTGN